MNHFMKMKVRAFGSIKIKLKGQFKENLETGQPNNSQNGTTRNFKRSPNVSGLFTGTLSSPYTNSFKLMRFISHAKVPC